MTLTFLSLSTDQVAAFVQLARQGSLRDAARVLHITEQGVRNRLLVLEGRLGTHTLRLGNFLTPDQLVATAAPGSSGPVFTLTGPAWTELLKSPRPTYEMPENVFAPE